MGKLIGRFAIIGGVFAVAVVVIVMLFATQPEPQRANSAPRPVAVFVEEAQQGTVSLTVTSQGEARPRTQINLVPQVAGRITYVNPDFIEGGFFEAGETLVQIDDADYRLAVTRASAQVAQAQQALAREQAESDLAAREWAELGEGEASALTLREPQLAEARAQLAAAEAALQAAVWTCSAPASPHRSTACPLQECGPGPVCLAGHQSGGGVFDRHGDGAPAADRPRSGPAGHSGRL